MKLIFYFNNLKKTGVIINSEKKYVRKFSSDNRSLILLKNEIRGYNWYLNQQKANQKLLKTVPTKQNPFIDFPLTKGKEVSYSSLLSDNYDYVQKVINFYKEWWPNKPVVPCHGDLTFANIIFKKNRLEIIDWENFILKEEWGYDICYFLISSLVLPFIIKKKTIIKNKELLVFEKLWKDFYKSNNFSYSSNPVKYIKNLVRSHNLRNYSKFYLNKLSGYQVNQINEVIN